MQAGGLTASDLYCRRGERRLFGGLDLSLDSGAALHLVGPNGIGKSSLLQMLAGLRKPERGRGGAVEWTGEVGLLDERPALNPDLPLGKALAFWSAIDGHDAALGRLGLHSLADVPVRFLSTGQRRRAGFARLLGQRARHWLLDEPLTGLDTDGVALAEALIAERRADGGVVVVVSHQPIALPGSHVLDLRGCPW